MFPSSRSDLLHQVALTMIPDIGPITARKLIENYGSARQVFKQSRESLQQIQGIGPRLSQTIRSSRSLDCARKEVDFLKKHHIDVLYIKDPDYPDRLRECVDAPLILYARGKRGLCSERSLSVVGTRRATSYGKDLCRAMIKDLSQLTPPPTIVSGLAYGIDVIAHRAALEFGLPTIAVLGHGMTTIYPSSHRETAKQITQQGALVTDFHSGLGPERNNFLRRNRIIAGLSQGTLVVESALSGGSLITAHMAHSYDRPVLAVPGRANDHRSAGCNKLIIRNIAAITESAADIIHHLNWDLPELRKHPSPAKLMLKPREKEILLQLEKTPGITPDMISMHTGIPVHEVLVLLLEMELKEWISAEPGMRYSSRVQVE